MDPIGQKLLHVAKDQLGYTEKPSGYTKYGDWYGKHVDKDSSYTNAPWCDMFLAWAADKAGVQDWAGQFASTPQHANWFKKHHAWGHHPEPGAIVFFSWNGGKSVGDIELPLVRGKAQVIASWHAPHTAALRGLPSLSVGAGKPAARQRTPG